MINYIKKCRADNKDGNFWNCCKFVFEPDKNKNFVTNLLTTDWVSFFQTDINFDLYCRDFYFRLNFPT